MQLGFVLLGTFWTCGSRDRNAGYALGMQALAGVKWKKWRLSRSPGISVQT